MTRGAMENGLSIGLIKPPLVKKFPDMTRCVFHDYYYEDVFLNFPAHCDIWDSTADGIVWSGTRQVHIALVCTLTGHVPILFVNSPSGMDLRGLAVLQHYKQETRNNQFDIYPG